MNVWIVDATNQIWYRPADGGSGNSWKYVLGPWSGSAGSYNTCAEVSEGSGYLFCVTTDQVVFQRRFPCSQGCEWYKVTGRLSCGPSDLFSSCTSAAPHVASHSNFVLTRAP